MILIDGNPEWLRSVGPQPVLVQGIDYESWNKGDDSEFIAARNELIRKAWSCPDLRARHSEIVSKARGTPEQRALTSAHNIERFKCKDARKRTQDSTTKARSTKESRAKTSAISTALWQDPEYVAKQSAARKLAWVKRRAKAADKAFMHERLNALLANQRAQTPAAVDHPPHQQPHELCSSSECLGYGERPSTKMNNYGVRIWGPWSGT